MIATVDQLVAVVDNRTGYNVLSDHRALDTPATKEQVTAIVEYVGRPGNPIHGGRWAIVTVLPASYGMMRMLSVHAEAVPIKVEVFREMVPALAWLSEARR